MSDVAKIVTIIGSSPESFAKAADAAVQEAAKTLRGISGAHVVSMSAVVEGDRITAYRTTVAPMGGSYWIPLSAEHRNAAGLAAGDRVDVDIDVDDEPRVVDVPADLAAALDRNPAARQAFDALSYSHQRQHVLAVEEAKKPETRQRRIEKAVADLSAGR